MDIFKQMLRHRSQHARPQRQRDAGNERFRDLYQRHADREELAQGRQRAGLHAERRDDVRRFCRTGVLRRRDVRSIRLWPFAGPDRHQRLDQHYFAAYGRPRRHEHISAPPDLRRGAHRKRMVCEHVAATGDTAGAADVSAVSELSRPDVLGSESGSQHGPDRDSAGRNVALEPSDRNQCDRRERQYGCKRDRGASIDRLHRHL